MQFDSNKTTYLFFISDTNYCDELPAHQNGFVEYITGDRSFGSNAAYKCFPGFILLEPTVERTCLGDGEWSIGETPLCLPHGNKVHVPLVPASNFPKKHIHKPQRRTD